MKLIVIVQKPFKCPQCKIRFTDRRNIPRHIENKHPKSTQKLQCILCKKLYQSKGNHDQHFERVHMAEYLLYTDPELVDTKGNPLQHKKHSLFEHNSNNSYCTNIFPTVRKGDRKVSSKSMVSRKQKSCTSGAKQYVDAHHVYGNPFGKDQFCTSESTLADKDFVERRQMVFAVEFILIN